MLTLIQQLCSMKHKNTNTYSGDKGNAKLLRVCVWSDLLLLLLLIPRFVASVITRVS